MALRKCTECGKRVSTKAKNCPHCGAPPPPPVKKSDSFGCLVLFFIGILIYIVCLVADKKKKLNNSSKTHLSANKPVPQKQKKSRKKTRKDRIKRQFHFWDGSHVGLTKFIKKAMHDPSSYEHIETVYWDKHDYLIVKTTFRGKNAFGGLIKNWVKAKVDLEGNVIEVISQGRP